MSHHPPHGGFLPGTVAHEDFFLVKDRCFSCPSFPRKTVVHCWALFCQGDTCAGGVFLIGLPLALCRSRHFRKNIVA